MWCKNGKPPKTKSELIPHITNEIWVVLWSYSLLFSNQRDFKPIPIVVNLLDMTMNNLELLISYWSQGPNRILTQAQKKEWGWQKARKATNIFRARCWHPPSFKKHTNFNFGYERQQQRQVCTNIENGTGKHQRWYTCKKH